MSFYQGEASRGSQRRGGWRGQDRHSRGLGCPDNPTSPTPQPLGLVLDSIDIRTLLVEEDALTIQNAEYVASYNWLNKSAIILVPGSPPAWSPPAQDTKLKPDSADVFRDINAARYPAYPLEPSFRALKAMEPTFPLRSVDVVGCGSTIGNLLRFAASQSQTKAFRFDVDVVGNTVIFARRECSPTELIVGLQGYGHTFPEAYTTWDSDVRNSCSHQRLVHYNFGGLKFLVRSETDGYVRVRNPIAPNSTAQLSLDKALSTVSLTSSMVSTSQKLEVRLQGTKIPQDLIFDLKTRASYKRFDMEEILPRLWVNQTSKFLIAYHKFGVFNNPKVEDVRGEVRAWESRNSDLLARFHAVVKRIVEVVRDLEGQQYEVSWSGQGPLLITRQIGEGRKALPSDIEELLSSK